MRSWAALIAVLVIAVVIGVIVWPRSTNLPVAPPAEQPRPPLLGLRKPARDIVPDTRDPEDAIRTSLAKSIDWDFKMARFHDVVREIEKSHAVSIEVDEKSINDADPNEPQVTLSLHGLSLREGLRSLVDPFHGMVEWDVTRDGTILIANDATCGRRHPLRMIAVPDLIDPADELDGQDIAFEPLITLITTQIHPGSAMDSPLWQQAGGTGTIKGWRTALVISARFDACEEVRSLVAGLREARKHSGDTSGPIAMIGVPVEDPTARAPVMQTMAKKRDFDLHDQPLKSVVAEICSAPGLLYAWNEQEVQERRIDREWRVSLAVKQISLGTALDQVLEPFGLGWSVERGAVRISLLEFRRPSTRVYAIGDLLDSPLTGTGKSPMTPEGTPPEDFTDARLPDLIQSSINPQSWASAGGVGAVYVLFNANALICTNTDDVHRQVEDLLQRLRQLPREAPATDPSGVALEWRVYKIPMAQSLPPADVVNILKQSLGEETFQVKGAVFEAKERRVDAPATDSAPAGPPTFDGAVVVRHTAQVQAEVLKIINQLLAKPIRAQRPSFGGGGLGSGFPSMGAP